MQLFVFVIGAASLFFFQHAHASRRTLNHIPTANSGAQKARSEIRQPTLKASDPLIVNFQPHEIGLVIDGNSGKVSKVIEDSQAEKSGVEVGMRLTRVKGESFTMERLKTQAAGEDAYQVTFERAPKAMSQPALSKTPSAKAAAGHAGSGTGSWITGLSGFLRGNRKSGSETGADLFIRAFKLGMRAAGKDLQSKDGKRVFDTGGKGQQRIWIKQWKEVNKALKKSRDAIIPPGYAEALVDNAFAQKIKDKYGKSVKKSHSRSGSIMFVSDYDDTTRSRFLLKSEKRTDFIDGMMPIYEKYAQQIAADDPCYQSTMMKVLMVFEPLDVDKMVDNKVWMLIQNINPFRPRKDNFVQEYDLKHSRPVDRCKSDSPREGALGDFLRDFGKPLRDAVAEKHPLSGSAITMHDDVHFKKTCLLSTVSKDLAVLDSQYPGVKLVDQSVLIFAIKPANNEPTPEEEEIVESNNNVFKVTRDGEIWFLVYGLIDLFASKNSKKWWQSHAENKNYIFSTTKFSLYPFYAFCMSQFFLYYNKFNVSGSVTWESEIGKSWPKCFKKGGVYEQRLTPDDYGKIKDTQAAHDAIRHDERMCSLIHSCDAVLHKERVANNLEDCCKNANDGNPCDM